MTPLEVLTLQFQTPQELGSFRKIINGKVLVSDVKNLTLVHGCSKKEVALVMNYYGRRVIDTKQQD